MSRRTSGVLLVALSAACFAAMPIFARTVYAAGSDPTTLLLLRFALAATVLLPLALRRPGARPAWPALAGLVLLGALYVCQSLLYFVALTMTPVTLLALLLYVYPVVVAVLASILFQIPLTRWRLVSLGLALTGAALTVIGPLGGGNWLGIVLALAAALTYSGYILLATRVTHSVDSLWSSAIITASAGTLFALLATLHGAALPATSLGWVAVVGIGLVSTVLAILAFMSGLARIGPTDAATLSVLEPVITALLAVLLLGESLGLAQLVGGALIVVAVLIVARVDAPRLEPIEKVAIEPAYEP
ncbi:MAG: EamA family transporter [Chloroflexi bacterium]|nr:EamA family transporter [Chloroflexota bacterium]